MQMSLAPTFFAWALSATLASRRKRSPRLSLVRTRYLLLWVVMVSLLHASSAFAWQQSADPQKKTIEHAPPQKRTSLFSLDLDELLNIEVISLKSEGQHVFTAPAALTVITPEDIRRTGHQRIPELLRLVPGLHVAQSNASTWNIGARGYTSQGNRLQLVQIDGRTIFSPFFGGVNWITADAVIEDIQSIEVLRGPGGSLWGANAVNGIINITTKPAKETQGLSLSNTFGSSLVSYNTLRFGGKLADSETYYRVYGKFDEHADHPNLILEESDDWRHKQGGFRIDWEGFERDRFTLQGDAYQTRAGTLRKAIDVPQGLNLAFDGDTDLNGGNVLGRWNRTLTETSRFEVLAYFDRMVLTDHVDAGFSIRSDTIGLEFKHSFVPMEGHELVWGLDYRFARNSFQEGNSGGFTRRIHEAHTYGVFFQDTITLSPDRLTLTLGTKLGHNDFSGFEIQPNVRLLWTPDERQTVWAAISRAVAIPSVNNRFIDFRLQAVAPGVAAGILGNESVGSENYMAYELGYRFRPHDHIWFDVTTFYNRGESVIAVDPTSDPLVLTFTNNATTDTSGFEIASHWQVREDWRISANYSFLELKEHGNRNAEGETPTNLAGLRSYYDISEDLELNAAIYYYDKIPGAGLGGWTRVDVGMTWRPDENVEIRVWGQNLIDNKHPEFHPNGFTTDALTEVPRGVFAQVKLSF